MNSLLGRALAQSASSLSTPNRLRFLLNPTLYLQSYATSTTTSAAGSSTRRKTSYKLHKANVFEPSTTPSDTAARPKPRESPAVAESEWVRPGEIPFQAKVANSVNLVGYVHIPVQFEASSDGKPWAGTVITQELASESAPLWIPIIFEGDLAHIARSHLKPNDCVHVCGQLSADPPHLNANEGQSNIQVMVHSLNFVEGYSQMKKSLTSHEQKRWLHHPDSVKQEVDVSQSWNDLLSNPHEWWDVRLKEDNPKGASFERKSNGELLRIDDSIPKLVQKQLETITFDCKTQLKSWTSTSAGVKKSGHTEPNSWRELLENPKQWWDYRSSKLSGSVNPKYPDFKSKTGDHALWLNRAPGWVLSELEGVEFDVKGQKPKQVNQYEGVKGQKPKQVNQNKGDNSWKDLVENPKCWWDNRSNKRNQKAPDFKHKETGEVLWLSNSPGWVLPKLPPVKSIGKSETLLS